MFRVLPSWLNLECLSLRLAALAPAASLATADTAAQMTAATTTPLVSSTRTVVCMPPPSPVDLGAGTPATDAGQITPDAFFDLDRFEGKVWSTGGLHAHVVEVCHRPLMRATLFGRCCSCLLPPCGCPRCVAPPAEDDEETTPPPPLPRTPSPQGNPVGRESTYPTGSLSSFVQRSKRLPHGADERAARRLFPSAEEEGDHDAAAAPPTAADALPSVRTEGEPGAGGGAWGAWAARSSIAAVLANGGGRPASGTERPPVPVPVPVPVEHSQGRATTTTDAQAAATAVRDALVGEWAQESVEGEKLEAILAEQGHHWAARKLMVAVRMGCAFSEDDDGALVFVSRVPGATSAVRCVDGACMEVAMLGTRMVYVVRWVEGGQALAMELTTHRKGHPPTTATITQRYDAATDRIHSHNESVEGSYVRTLRRVGPRRSPPAGARESAAALRPRHEGPRREDAHWPQAQRAGPGGGGAEMI